MGYKIRDGLPSTRANTVELADFIEIECLKKNNLTFSFLEILKSLDTNDDYQEDEVDENNFTRDNIEEPRVEDALTEIEIRRSFCNGKYPFVVDANLVSYNQVDPRISLVYIYLLFATRLFMGGKKAEKVHGNIDGTLLFERLCEEILKSYWGERSDTYLFGTSTSNKFQEKVNILIGNLKEGGSFKNPDKLPPPENDGNLDVAVWKAFTDKRSSQILGFAQCKTGDTWSGELRKLDPGSFVDTWFAEPTSLTPFNIFMVADVARDFYKKHFMNLLFFDRCRIMDFLPAKLDNELLERISRWVSGALKKYSIDYDALGLPQLQQSS